MYEYYTVTWAYFDTYEEICANVASYGKMFNLGIFYKGMQVGDMNNLTNCRPEDISSNSELLKRISTRTVLRQFVCIVDDVTEHIKVLTLRRMSQERINRDYSAYNTKIIPGGAVDSDLVKYVEENVPLTYTLRCSGISLLQIMHIEKLGYHVLQAEDSLVAFVGKKIGKGYSFIAAMGVDNNILFICTTSSEDAR